MLNRTAFYASVRASLGKGLLTPSQFAGLQAILDAAPADLPLPHLAYCLATAHHETATAMLPIREKGGPAYFMRYDPKGPKPKVAKALGNTKPGDGPLFHGRGYVQLTGRANYLKATVALRVLGIRVDLIATPDDAMRPEIAAVIMFAGMREGWFTGWKLSHYDFGTKTGPVEARRIINGTDCAEKIAGYFALFMAAIYAADPPLVAAAPKPLGVIARLKGAFSRAA